MKKRQLLAVPDGTDGKREDTENSYRSFERAVLEIYGTLLDQNVTEQLLRSTSNRVLLVTWLVFSFIVGTVYRGNLIAALTIPKAPARPETVKEVVSYVDR